MSNNPVPVHIIHVWSQQTLFNTWYRSVNHDGTVWCESSDRQEVIDKSGDRKLQMLNQFLVSDGWEDWDGQI